MWTEARFCAYTPWSVFWKSFLIFHVLLLFLLLFLSFCCSVLCSFCFLFLNNYFVLLLFTFCFGFVCFCFVVVFSVFFVFSFFLWENQVFQRHIVRGFDPQSRLARALSYGPINPNQHSFSQTPCSYKLDWWRKGFVAI